jgi:two-component system, sensor histidine kinase PdtaS
MTLISSSEGLAKSGAASASRGARTDATPVDACDGSGGATCARLAEVRMREAIAEQHVLELNHRMANLLQAVVVGIQRQRRLQDTDAARDELERLEARIEAAAALQRRLLEGGRHDRVEFGQLLAGLASDIEGVTGLVCHVHAEPVSLPGVVATQLLTGINELAWNAFKHGYRGVPGGSVWIVSRRDGAGRLRLSVVDRGGGLPPGFDPHATTGLGLSIVRGLGQRFAGELSVNQDRGTRFTLVLPLVRLRQKRP